MRDNAGTSAVDALLAGLIDYAGFFPPAQLGLREVVENYLMYRDGPHSRSLRRLIVPSNELTNLARVAAYRIDDIPLSVIVNLGEVSLIDAALQQGLRIEALECRVSTIADIRQAAEQLPAQFERYVEVPWSGVNPQLLDAIASASLFAKLRMGGVVPHAIPPARDVVNMLAALAERHIAFKATAGLHHPLRSRQPLTGTAEGPEAVMHGFVNLACAAASIYFGGSVEKARAVLEANDPNDWRTTDDRILCRDMEWNSAQILQLRDTFFLSFGSCSFEEPLGDLRTLGWL